MSQRERARTAPAQDTSAPLDQEPQLATVEDTTAPARLRWARLRFAIVGPLLASPPESGELAERIGELAKRHWKHPTTGEAVHYSAKSIERMYYAVRKSQDPIRALERKVPAHAGTHPSVSAALSSATEKQYRDHPGWTYRLHFDNLLVVAKQDPAMGKMPGYATVRRFMKDQGWTRVKDRRLRKDGSRSRVARETRSYEVPHVNALWHYDFHKGRRNVLTASGEYVTPYLFGLLDDCSRLCCHAQWYIDPENTESLVHGLCQGFQKRKLPRATLSDNGGAMIAAETVQGCERLSVLQYLTLEQSPEQNGKQEHFWTQVEDRLMAMLEGEPALTLEVLNVATQAWVEQEYHQTIHRELGKTPLQRYLEGPDIGRECPGSKDLRRAFRMEVTRTQRLSDGTVSVAGVRFEVPSAYRTLRQVRLRVARWDLSSIELVDPRRGTHLADLLPLDKVANADRARRTLAAAATPLRPAAKPPGIAPLLRQLMAEYAATGLPPAYLPKGERAGAAAEEEEELSS